MAGKTEAEAVNNYVELLQKAVSCISRAVLDVSGGYYASDKPHSLTLGDGLPQRLAGSSLYLSIKQLYRIVEETDPNRDPWRVTIIEYIYTLRRAGASERPERLVSYQWHPRPGARYNYPHLHLGTALGVGKPGQTGQLSSRSHLPTGRIAVEDVIRFVISQLNVPELRSDWRQVLNETQAIHEEWRTWPRSGRTT